MTDSNLVKSQREDLLKLICSENGLDYEEYKDKLLDNTTFDGQNNILDYDNPVYYEDTNFVSYYPYKNSTVILLANGDSNIYYGSVIFKYNKLNLCNLQEDNLSIDINKEEFNNNLGIDYDWNVYQQFQNTINSKIINAVNEKLGIKLNTGSSYITYNFNIIDLEKFNPTENRNVIIEQAINSIKYYTEVPGLKVNVNIIYPEHLEDLEDIFPETNLNGFN